MTGSAVRDAGRADAGRVEAAPGDVRDAGLRHAGEADGPARGRVLELIAGVGPVTAADLAGRLGVTPAAIRRHLAQLELDGLIAVHVRPSPRTRGRPARAYVTTARGQSELSGAYSDIAVAALRRLEQALGEEAVLEFARSRFAAAGERYAPRLAGAPGGIEPGGIEPTDAGRTDTEPGDAVIGVAERARRLAEALTEEGFAASVRPVPGAPTIQLCQGHCPVQRVAAEFPALCDEEMRLFSRLLGTHVQRLSTIAAGAHACTTTIPILPRPRAGSTGTVPTGAGHAGAVRTGPSAPNPATKD